MISFIVTTYNLEDRLLHRCLSSIVSQGLARDEYEIIVVDDESTVPPRHVVEAYAHQAHIALYEQRHARQGAARNLALSHAKGQWVQFVDGDDYLFPHTIAPLLRSAEDNDLDLLMFTFRQVHEDAEGNISKENSSENNCQLSLVNCQLNCPLSIVPCQLKIVSGDSYMHRHNLFGSCCTLFFRRDLCESGFNGSPLRFTENIYVEDEEFITKLTWRAQRMAQTNTEAYAYYQRPGSTTHNSNREHTDELFRNYFTVLQRLIHFEREVAAYTHDGLTRKIRFLAIDILRLSLREPDWKERWYQSIKQLLALNLYPIPKAGYSWKYRTFRLLAKGEIGSYILRAFEKVRAPRT